MAMTEQQKARIVELESALSDLIQQCGHISPLAGKPSTVKSIRQAGKFVAAVDRAEFVLMNGRGGTRRRPACTCSQYFADRKGATDPTCFHHGDEQHKGKPDPSYYETQRIDGATK